MTVLWVPWRGVHDDDSITLQIEQNTRTVFNVIAIIQVGLFFALGGYDPLLYSSYVGISYPL